MGTSGKDQVRGDDESRQGDPWKDPAIPAGNSPPLPAWPLWGSAALWFTWLIVLVTLAVGWAV